MDRRTFLQGTLASAATLAMSHRGLANNSTLNLVYPQIEKHHDKAVQRLQEWIKQPSIAAENREVNEGCELTMRFLREAGFDQVTKIPTDGQPGIFARFDAGAPKTLGLYFMYDVKQVDPSEWSSPPWDAKLVEKPGLGTVLVGRGAVNQKGPEASFIAALHAIRAAGRKPPVNLVLVAEGEEEIGSPHFPQIVRRPEVMAALRPCVGIFMPSAEQDLDGIVTMTLGAKGVVELELVSSGERWGRGPRHDIHSSNKARVDSPVWHLVEALATLVSPDGNDPVIEGFADKVRPTSAAERAMIAAAAQRLNESVAKKQMGVEHWIHDVSWQEALEMLMSRPTVNIEVGETKTEASCRPLPLHPSLVDCLIKLHRDTVYHRPEDWVFANDAGRPRWQETILKRHLKPAALRAGVGKIGWHTFRHTYSTMLRGAGTDIKVQQELLRHANIQTTMNIYTQAVSDQKRAANSKVVEMVLPRPASVGSEKESIGNDVNGSVLGADSQSAPSRQLASSD